MAITTYAELQTAVADWLARSDLTDYIPDHVKLFEAAAARILNVRPMETSATVSMSSGAGALPSDYLAARRVTLSGYGELTYAHPTFLMGAYPTSDQGAPQYYTIEGGYLKVRPVDDTKTYVLSYFAKNDAVSSSLNWLFTNHPDAYLFGTLCEAYMFDKDIENANIWKQRRDEVFNEIKAQSFLNAASMSVKPEGPVV